ncbi:carboxylesterase [Pseudohalioglobus lutimaris]|uniref:Carboxylesterase n=2 Tax=Pseudohalioglobus lutimaris TaxID=1737061 RepID=A0A2N5X2L2_9GAMM|nr:carboxylesterase [Pseudohalioglobus lutimaris]
MIVGTVSLFKLPALAADPIVVNVDNFVRAETAVNFNKTLKLTNGEVNKLFHFREPMPLDDPTVIRSNRDTLYSGAIVDISKGATLTIPETNGRYVSVMVVNEDHYLNKMYHGQGTYKLTMDEFDTPYVNVTIRTLVDASDPEDVKQVRAIQDGMVLQANSAKPYTHPQYDQASYEAAYKAVIELSRFLPDTKRTFGKKEDVSEVRHMLGTAMGWGGLPEHEAYYLTIEPNLPVGAYELTVKDVPVDAFWSISLYNKDGYFQENEYNAYSVNSITGTPNEDGSFTVHFGGDPESVNYLYIMEGWNYSVRLYQPRKEILEGEWTFPDVKPVQ